MIFKKEFLLDILDSDKGLIYTNLVDTSRWSLYYEMVFEFEGKFYKTAYSVGATECQDESPFEFDPDEIECQEVFKKEKLVTVYE